MMTRQLSFCVALLMACVCAESYGQQQGSGDSQNASATAQSGKAAPSTLPPPPPNLALQTPTQAQVSNSQGPVLSAAPNTTVTLPSKQGFPGLPQATGSVSISDHDADKGQDILGDLVGQAAKDQGLDVSVRSPEISSPFWDALESASKRIGVPELAFDAVKEGALVLDSEPTAGKSLDYPDTTRWGQSVVGNLGSVLGGNPSPFGDQDLIQACNRLRSYLAQNQSNLDATAQSNLQQVLAMSCSQQVSTGGVQNATAPRVAPASSPQTPPTKAKPGSCAPGAKVCH